MYPHFKNPFHNKTKYFTETLSICIFDCLKMLLTTMIKDEYNSKVWTQSDSTFLFRNKIKIGAGSSLILEIISEYDQDIPQSQTEDNPVAPRGRATQPP